MTRSSTTQPMRKPAPIPKHVPVLTNPHNSSNQWSITRNTKITCLTYGKYRKIVFPGYKFCSKCDNWENDCLLLSGIKRHSRNYMCQANHTNPLFPTERIEPYCPSITIQAASISAESKQGPTVAFENLYKTTNDIGHTGKFYYYI